jgi:hypothetical protein
LPLALGEGAVLPADAFVLLHERSDHEQADRTNGEVDEEDPRPVPVVDDGAAERRPDRRPQHDDHAEDGHRHPLLALRERLPQNGLLGGLGGAGAQPLERAVRDELRQRLRRAAERRAEEEEQEAQHVHALLPEHAPEERRERHEQDERHRVTRADQEISWMVAPSAP